MALKLSHLYLCFLLFQIQLMIANSRTLKSNVQSFNFLEGSQKGQTTKGLSEVKNYLRTFGYYPNNVLAGTDLTNDYFDDLLESAVKAYQKNYRLDVTGILGSDTIEAMMIPRCGVPDPVDHPSKPGKFQLVSDYSLTNKRWPPDHTELTYRFLSDVQIQAISLEQLRSASSRAFERWASASAIFTFQEVSSDGNAKADIVIGFERGDHGDGAPFDGPGHILAHSFLPTDGRSHYDADEPWSTDPSMSEMDLESVLVHEIGHLLGLAHSMDPNAIMYPRIRLGTIKRDLTEDDIDGIKAQYSH